MRTICHPSKYKSTQLPYVRGQYTRHVGVLVLKFRTYYDQQVFLSRFECSWFKKPIATLTEDGSPPRSKRTELWRSHMSGGRHELIYGGFPSLAASSS